jgi:hypothetical protein
VRNDSAECLILGHLDGQELACALGKRTPRPQDDAVRIGIARGDPLGIEITPLLPVDTRTLRRFNPNERNTDCCGSFEKGSAACRHCFSLRSGLGLARPRDSAANAHYKNYIVRASWPDGNMVGRISTFRVLLDSNVEPGWQSQVGQTITKKLAEASFVKTSKRNFH